MIKEHEIKSGKTCLSSKQGNRKKAEWLYKYVVEVYEIH